MRFQFTVQCDDWNTIPLPSQLAFVGRCVEALILENVAWLLRGDRWKRLPLLYESGVRFQREDDGSPNEWHSIPTVKALGHSHCVGLSAWRAAELRVRYGDNARPLVLEFRETRPVVGRVQEFHVQVRREDGTIEDPSRRLGMP